MGDGRDFSVNMSVALRAIIKEFRYPGAPSPALEGIDLTIAPGEFVLVVGPGGSGKTTLCYCLTGVIPKSVHGHFDGAVAVAGQDLASLPLPRISPMLGMVQQSPENQLFNVTAGEDVAFGPENLQLPLSEIEARVREALQFTGTAHLAGRFSHLLSGGESQRVVLASVLALGAGIYVFDQPAAELDPAGRREIYENIARLNRDAGKTIILVEDRLSDVVPHATRILLLHEGRIVRDLPSERFFTRRDLGTYGVRIPDTIALYHHLADAGLPVSGFPLTVSEAVEGLRPLLAAYSPAAASESEAPDDDPRSATVVGAPLGGDPPGTSTAPTVIEVAGLFHRYQAGVEALRGMDLTVGQGEFLAIVGENGAGKTTLAKHLVGLLRPTRGIVRIMGHDISRLPVHRISHWIGFLFQDPDWQIFNNSCLEEVAYGLKLRHDDPARIRQTAMEALERVGLSDLSDVHPYTLSRGQRQRLAAASILAIRPPMLVVDEPTTGLDYRESLAMMAVLEEYRRAGGTVLIITHDMEMATRFARRIVVMAGGRIAYDLPADRIQEHYDALAGSAIVLPDIARIARALALPSTLRGVEGVTAALLARSAMRTVERG